MIQCPDIDFVVAGGARYGLGHVMRSGALAAAAVERGWRVRTFLAGDRVARERWRAGCPTSRVEGWSAWRAAASAPLTVFDHPFSKSRWIAACRRERTRAIVLDDARTIGRARLTINPALHHLPLDADPARENPEDDPASLTLRGPRYSILSLAHRETPHRPLAARDMLLLSLGGADPHAVTPRVAPLLVRTLDAATIPHGLRRRCVVLGPAYPDPDGRAAAELTAAGWRVERALEPAAMARCMAEARLAVMGFGTSLTELAWHGTPHLSLTHHAQDAPWALRLEALGIGGWLGHAAALDADFVAARLRRALGDPGWQRASADRARAAIEGGRGCERILERLAAIAQELPARRPLRSGLGQGTSRALLS